MGHLTFELILWILLAFLIGCILGCLSRKLFGAAPQQEPAETMPAPEPEKVTEKITEKTIDKAEPELKPEPVSLASSTGVAKRPKGLAAARGGKGDELQAISGVGPKLDKTLNRLGFFHFDQIANWSPDEVKWVDEHLRFKGRIEREEWIPQAKLLAAGDNAEFSRLYGTGGMKTGQDGKSQSGERTQKAKTSAGKTGEVSKFKSDGKPANPSQSTGVSALKQSDEKSAPKVEPKTAIGTGVAAVPKKLTAARGGKADDLQQISGVGPKLEQTLQGLGFYHFDQIADWTPDEVQWVDENLTFKGRIEREEWIPQCKLLAAGKMDEFTKLYGSGGLKTQETGKTQSGSRTKKT